MELTPKEKAEFIVRELQEKVKEHLYYDQAIESATLFVDMQKDLMIEINTEKSLELFNYFQDVRKELLKL
jgi:hypothetical protein